MEVSPRSQQLAVTGPSIVENIVNDPSIFKKNGTNFGRPRKYCYPASIDRICTWNVEGMGKDSVKFAELRLFMTKHGIGILCLQETHLFGAHLVEEDGFSVFLSGACVDHVGQSYAGVGFMVAPWAMRAVVSFRAINERLAALRVKVSGGVLNIVTAYAPHDGHDFESRHAFFTNLADNTRRRGYFEETIVLGDFNAQLGYSGEGEHHIVGPFVFRKALRQKSSISNRELLMEYCMTYSMHITNTFFDYPDDCLVSYFNLVAKPMDIISQTTFAQIDHVLCSQDNPDLVLDCWTIRTDALQSHHFPTILSLRLNFEKVSRSTKPRKALTSLREAFTQSLFADTFNASLVGADNLAFLADHEVKINDAFGDAAKVLPDVEVEPKKPWISAKTLQYISDRNGARRDHDYPEELRLNRIIRASAKHDRGVFLQEELKDGNWGAVKRLRQGICKKHLNMKDMSGNFVDTSERPDTMAKYFSDVQWKVQFANLCPDGIYLIHSEIPISVDAFSHTEVHRVLDKLKNGKASGHDDIPPDFWRALRSSFDAVGELLALCNHCWRDRDIPETWRVAKVVLLFKKGDTALPENYRPISLLPVGYKVLAALIHQRLLDGGADERIRPSQFGFRPKRNCMDALMVVRRLIDAANEEKRSGLIMVFLDWAKAFDRLKPDTLVVALRRFGLPEQFVQMIESIYRVRRFFIQDHTGASAEYQQSAGIAQGCPLSPFLFIIVQSVMFHDIYNQIHLEPEPEFVVTRDLLYADDTLLVSSSRANLQLLLNSVVSEGAKYGLELNWTKTFQMTICTTSIISRPDGGLIEKKRDIVYLGGLISCDGRCARELSRRIGEGHSIFKILSKLWTHSGITLTRKVLLFNACVTSKVLYSLESVWLLKADKTRLDAFQCYCMRRILRIAPSFISRVTNVDVLECARVQRFSTLIEDRQRKLYHKIQWHVPSAFSKMLVFDNFGQPKTWFGRRGRGRPRQTWAKCVHKLVMERGR